MLLSPAWAQRYDHWCWEVAEKPLPQVRVVPWRPSASPVLSGGLPAAHKSGHWRGFCPKVLNTQILDEIVAIDEMILRDGATAGLMTRVLLVAYRLGPPVLAALQGPSGRPKKLGGVYLS